MAEGNTSGEQLVEVLEKLLGCDRDLRFLLQFDDKCLEQLIVAIRIKLS